MALFVAFAFSFFSRVEFLCRIGMQKYKINPLNTIELPANRKLSVYDWVSSNIKPAIGGPIKLPMPWNSSRRPNALVSLSIPNKSTRMTDVNPTRAPTNVKQCEYIRVYSKCVVLLTRMIYLSSYRRRVQRTLNKWPMMESQGNTRN